MLNELHADAGDVGRSGASRLCMSAARRLTMLVVLMLVGACMGDAPRSESKRTAGAEPDGTEMPAGLRAAFIASRQADADVRYWFDARARTHNPAHALSATLANGGLAIAPDTATPKWTATLRWTGLGRAGRLGHVASPTDVDGEHNRARYRRDDGSDEWYLNGPLGIEQGFELAERPAGNGQLELVVGVDGLRPELAGQRIKLMDDAGRAALIYSDLFVRDAGGRVLDASMATRGSAIVLSIDDAQARYPLSVDPLIWTEIAKLTASDAEASDLFGLSVSVNGDTAVVGAYAESSGGAYAGASYVFSRDGDDTWGEVKKLTPSDPALNAFFGYSVSVSGDTVVVGALGNASEGSNAGAAYVFSRDHGGANNWGEVTKLTASDAEADDYFGVSVAVNGDTAVVGAYYESDFDAGAAYVFSRNHGGANSWGQVKKLVASDTGALPDYFGTSVALSGDTVIVGAFNQGAGAGAAYVFERDEGGTDNWGEKRKLTASDAAAGAFFGISVSASGDHAIVGAYQESSGGAHAGAAYIFSRDEGGTNNWGEVRKLTAIDAGADDELGIAVSISGDTAAVGAQGVDRAGANAGAVYLFSRDEGGADNWGQVRSLTASDADANDSFGVSVSVSGETAIVGAYFEDGAAQNAGAAYVLSTRQADGDACAQDAVCLSGHCVDGVCCENACGGGGDDCVACSVAHGSSINGVCMPRPDGAGCSDGSFCNGTESCTAGVCGSSSGDPCPGPDGDGDCAESCDETADSCTQNDADATVCDDGTFCNGSETCTAGVCGGSSGDPCPGADGDGDCAESCDELARDCSLADANATSCTDGNACTQADSCFDGVCVGSDPITCTALDVCHDPGVCDPATGMCSDPNKPDGSDCPGDGTCDGGMCVPPSSSDGGAGGSSAGEGGSSAGEGGASSTGCATDNECKGDRVCNGGQCIDASSGCTFTRPSPQSRSAWLALSLALFFLRRRTHPSP